MDDFQKTLIIIYSIIFIILLIIEWLVPIKKVNNLPTSLGNSKGKNNVEKYKFKTISILLIIFLFIIMPIGVYLMFCLTYMIATIIYPDEFISMQIITNIPNYFMIYMIIHIIKENLKTSK